MDTLLLYLGPILGCVGMMAVFMYVMGRGMRGGQRGQRAASDETTTAEEAGRLREEVARLRAERGEQAERSAPPRA